MLAAELLVTETPADMEQTQIPRAAVTFQVQEAETAVAPAEAAEPLALTLLEAAEEQVAILEPAELAHIAIIMEQAEVAERVAEVVQEPQASIVDTVGALVEVVLV